MAHETSNDDSGRTAQSYLERVKPKDLVMFSPKTRAEIAKSDYSFMQPSDYDVSLPSDESQNETRVWGMRQLFKPTSPACLGLASGLCVGSLYNIFKKRPAFSNIYIHAIAAVVFALSISKGSAVKEQWQVQNELAVWDYVKRHPQDFPEVFIPAKRYKDMLLPWKPVR